MDDFKATKELIYGSTEPVNTVFDDEETKKIFDRLDIKPGTRGEILYRSMVKNSVEFLLYTMARLLYPNWHYLHVLNDKEKFPELRALVEKNYKDIEAVMKDLFISLGRVGDKICEEVLDQFKHEVK